MKYNLNCELREANNLMLSNPHEDGFNMHCTFIVKYRSERKKCDQMVVFTICFGIHQLPLLVVVLIVIGIGWGLGLELDEDEV